MDNFGAEIVAGATKLSWKTNFEQNALGFRIWREEGGQRQPVNQEMIAGSLLKVSNGLLSAGSEYTFYDQTDSPAAQYWLEAVDINAKSLWFGPAFPVTGPGTMDAAAESETLSQVRQSVAGRRQQVDKVDFATSNLKGSKKQSALSPDAAFGADDPDALKIEVRNRGMYRVDANALAEFGFNNLDADNWKLFAGGVEQPIIVNNDGTIEFFGSGTDTIQTDANVYWLLSDSTAGRRINRVAQDYQQAADDGFYQMTAERRDKALRISSVINGARENWFGTVVNSTASNQTLILSDIAAGSNLTATLGVDLQGLTNLPHQVSVMLNGFPIGQINFNLYDRIEWRTIVPVSYLLEGTNTITLKSLGGTSDVNVTEAVRIIYPRQLKAQNNRLEFTHDGQRIVKLKNFTSPQVRLFDVTNPEHTVEYAPESRQETDGTYTVTVPASTTPRLMIAQGENSQFLAATPLIKNKPSDLRNPQNQAKFLIIAPREFHKSLNDFREFRNWEGMQTEVIDIEDIYDEFNYGVKSAESIRSFLQYAKQNWAVKPDYAMLAGDASIDPRNYTGFGGDFNNRVPTMLTDTWNMETVSDEMMADFDGDDVGELSLGRLPAKSREELESMLQRIVNTTAMTKSEVNERGVHFVSDAFIGYDFAGGSRHAASTIPSDISVNYLDRTTQPATVLRSDIVGRISSGAAIVNYFGHASVGAWTNAQIFRNVDAQNVSNGKRSALMVMLACLNGDFVETNIDGIAEAVMKHRIGGAFAVWAASGWNTAQAQEYMAKDFYRNVFAGMRLGDAARQAKASTIFVDQKRTYVFFGDPTQRMVEP